jgi:hypothetical protein
MSVGTNTWAACRARRKNSLVKRGVLVEVADECIYWARILEEFLEIDKHHLLELKQKAE